MEERSTAKDLPDDVWIFIFQTGIKKSKFSIGDLASISSTSTSFRRLAEEDVLWTALLALHFPEDDICDSYCESSASSKKDIYKYQLQRNLQQKITSIQLEVSKVNYQLRESRSLFKRSEFQTLVTINKKLDKLAGEFIEYITVCAMDYKEAVKLLEDRVVLAKEQYKEYLIQLIEKTKARFYGVSNKYRFYGESGAGAGAGACNSISHVSPSTDVVDDFVERVEIKLSELLRDQQISKQEMGRYSSYRVECERELAALTSQLTKLNISGQVAEFEVENEEANIQAAEFEVENEEANIQAAQVAGMTKFTLIDYLFG